MCRDNDGDEYHNNGWGEEIKKLNEEEVDGFVERVGQRGPEWGNSVEFRQPLVVAR